MKSIFRTAALAAMSVASLAFAATPPAASATPAPAAKAAAPAEYPCSCVPAAKAAFVKGLTANFNAQLETARELFKQAIAADPKCAIAKAQLGYITPGPEGKALLDEAAPLAATLPEIEKYDLQGVLASSNGESPKAFDLAAKARDLRPNCALLNIKVALFAGDLQKYDEQLASAKRAAELDPKSGAAWNMVGYGYSGLNKTEDAVAAFRKYAEVAPTEPNAHDSLADALLRANQLDEAGASYQKAIDSSAGKFWYSYDGVATVKAIKGDWDGARAALAKRVESATTDVDKGFGHYMIAWTWQAQGKPADATKAIDAYEKEATAGKNDAGLLNAAVTRGQFQVLNGKFADALKSFAAAEKVKTDAIPGAFKNWATMQRLTGTIEANAKLKKLPDADKALAALDTLVKANPTDPTGNDFLQHGKALIALARKDPKGAVELLKATSPQADLSKLLLAEAQDAAGDAAGATETRATLLKTNHRNAESWFVHARLEAKNKVPGKKVAAEAAPKK